MTQNVLLINSTQNTLSRQQLLEWLNEKLGSDIDKIDDLCTGAAYCQLMNIIYPGAVNLKKVKFFTNIEQEFRENFILLQNAFIKHGVTYAIPTSSLVKGRFTDNYTFLQWFKLFFDANHVQRHYDPLAARNYQKIGLKHLPTLY